MEGELRHAVAANVRALRKTQALSQEAFAHLYGLQRTWLGAVERGERNLTLRSLERLAARLGLSPFTLVAPGQDVGPEEAREGVGGRDVARGGPEDRAEGGS